MVKRKHPRPLVIDPPKEDPTYPLWRIIKPGTNLVYNAVIADWIEKGSGYYSIFTNAQKQRHFKNDRERNWEAFGWPIPLYDDPNNPEE
jgi:hypothetical protein